MANTKEKNSPNCQKRKAQRPKKKSKVIWSSDHLKKIKLLKKLKRKRV